MKEFNPAGYVIRLSEQSLISLVMSALEAYVVENQNITHRENIQLEVFGNLFGQEINMANGKILYNVEFVHTDTTAKQRTGDVTPNDDALALKNDLVRSYWPHLSYLGDFHTHPDDHVKKIKELKNFYFSLGDRQCLFDHQEYFEKINYRIGLVLAVSRLEKKSTKYNRWHGSQLNRIEITKGNLRIWIGGYIAFLDSDGDAVYSKDNDSKVILDIPSIMGLNFEHNDFGKFDVKEEIKKYKSAK